MNAVRAMACLLVLGILAGCQGAAPPPAPAPKVAADVIYFGGDIVTVNDAQPSVEALAVKDGKILAVGTRADLLANDQGAQTRTVDLKGKALLPGFIDPHSHYIAAIPLATQVNVFAPPAGPGADPASIVAALKKFRDEHHVPAGEVIQAYGYDDSAMPKGKALTRYDLDKDFPDNPVVVGHVSMHGAVLNSAALKKYGISAATKTPAGGVIVRKSGSNEPLGLLMETAFMPVMHQLPRPDAAAEHDGSIAAQKLYASYGITTAQEGATHEADVELMQRVGASGANIIDIVAYPFVTDFDAILAKNPVANWGRYINRLKLGGAKITLDGSPQGKTAWFTTPYLTGGPGGEKNWAGEPTFPEEYVKAFFKKVYDLGLPLNVHANGDAAVDLLLRAHAYASAADPAKDRHLTVIHSQFVRADQLDQYVKYRMTPSFFTLHTFYFGAAHVRNRGEQQAAFLSPMRAAIDKGLKPTNHTDFVVAPLDQMMVLWSAVNRVTREGGVLGPDQRVTPLESLKAITINAATQYLEQDSKGTLEPGKLADLVILDRNPLTVEPMAIRDIKVVETLKEGKTIYAAE
jgi:predicted amidohydrolase YtcJ